MRKIVCGVKSAHNGARLYELLMSKISHSKQLLIKTCFTSGYFTPSQIYTWLQVQIIKLAYTWHMSGSTPSLSLFTVCITSTNLACHLGNPQQSSTLNRLISMTKTNFSNILYISSVLTFTMIVILVMDFNTRENKYLVAKVLCPSIILHTWSVLVGYTTKTKLCLILETTLLMTLFVVLKCIKGIYWIHGIQITWHISWWLEDSREFLVTKCTSSCKSQVQCLCDNSGFPRYVDDKLNSLDSSP